MHRHQLSCPRVHWFVHVLFFKEWSRVSYKEGHPGIYSFAEISAAELGFEEFSRSSKVLLFFLSFPLVWWCPLLIFPSTSNFPFLQAFWFFSLDLAVLFLPLSFFLFSLWAWNIFSVPISIPISLLYIIILCIRIFSFFCKQLDVVYVHKLLLLLLLLLFYTLWVFLSALTRGWVTTSFLWFLELFSVF